MLKPNLVWKMNKVFVSPEAGRDLSEIRRYIAKELKNPGSARKTINEILKNLKSLGRFPEQGPSVEALTGFTTDLRILLCGNHIALYKIEHNIVYISRIVDARQDYLRILFGDDYWKDNHSSASDYDDRIKLAESLFGFFPENETIEQAKSEHLRKI